MEKCFESCKLVPNAYCLGGPVVFQFKDFRPLRINLKRWLLRIVYIRLAKKIKKVSKNRARMIGSQVSAIIQGEASSLLTYSYAGYLNIYELFME